MEFSSAAVKYALNAIGGVDIVALNHLDIFESPGDAAIMMRHVMDLADVSGMLAGFGPTYEDREIGDQPMMLVGPLLKKALNSVR